MFTRLATFVSAYGASIFVIFGLASAPAHAGENARSIVFRDTAQTETLNDAVLDGSGDIIFETAPRDSHGDHSKDRILVFRVSDGYLKYVVKPPCPVVEGTVFATVREWYVACEYPVTTVTPPTKVVAYDDASGRQLAERSFSDTLGVVAAGDHVIDHGNHGVGIVDVKSLRTLATISGFVADTDGRRMLVERCDQVALVDLDAKRPTATLKLPAEAKPSSEDCDGKDATVQLDPAGFAYLARGDAKTARPREEIVRRRMDGTVASRTSVPYFTQLVSTVAGDGTTYLVEPVDTSYPKERLALVHVDRNGRQIGKIVVEGKIDSPPHLYDAGGVTLVAADDGIDVLTADGNRIARKLVLPPPVRDGGITSTHGGLLLIKSPHATAVVRARTNGAPQPLVIDLPNP